MHHLHLALTYYHFVRYHASLRVELPEPIPTRGNDSPKKWQRRKAAMAADLTDHHQPSSRAGSGADKCHAS
jgi:hypothetical protein